MPVITFANTKGGSGKTTAALLLACSVARKYPTTIIDADPRHPITRWSKLPGVPGTLTVVRNEGEKTILDNVDEAATRDPFVIIDLEGTASRLMSYALSQSDLVVIPLKEQQQDALAALDVIAEINRDMKALRRTIPFVCVFTQSRAAVKSRTAKHIATQLRQNPSIHVLNAEVHERDAFAAIFSIGGTLDTMDRSKVNGVEKAIANVNVYTSELIDLIKAVQSQSGEAA